MSAVEALATSGASERWAEWHPHTTPDIRQTQLRNRIDWPLHSDDVVPIVDDNTTIDSTDFDLPFIPLGGTAGTAGPMGRWKRSSSVIQSRPKSTFAIPLSPVASTYAGVRAVLCENGGGALLRALS
jgi:hypothetical protein